MKRSVVVALLLLVPWPALSGCSTCWDTVPGALWYTACGMSCVRDGRHEGDKCGCTERCPCWRRGGAQK